MIDLAIIVEGETEELFVNRVLAPFLWARGVHSWPKPTPGSKAWQRVRNDAKRLLRQRADRYCAVLFDYYALTTDWPGRVEASTRLPMQRGAFVEAALSVDLATSLGGDFRQERFLPHIQLHEFEAKLFSNCAALGDVLGLDASVLLDVVSKCGAPEMIDDGVHTAPSKRLDQLCKTLTGRGYAKKSDGVTAAERITLPVMRAACPHFAGWLSRIESLGTPLAEGANP